MASSLSELISASPEQGNPAAAAVDGVKAGLGLAQAQEQVQSAKLQVEAQKADLATKQASTVNSLLTNLARANPVIAKKMVKQVRERLIQLGADPDIADYTISDDANRQRQVAFSDMASGKLSSDPEAALRYFQSAGQVLGWDEGAKNFDLALKRQQEDKKMAQAAAQDDKELAQKNQQFYAGLKNQKDIASMNNETKLAKTPSGGGPTIGEKARDTKFAKDYSAFFDSGGAATIEANLSSLDDSLSALEKGKTSKYTGLLGETAQNFIDPETANVRTNVTGVLIQGLKDTFGGQLSDGERKAMVESAYVASAEPKDNAKRVRALADKIKAAARAKEMAGQYFEENGTLKGFKGTESFNIGGKTVKIGPPKDSAQSTSAPQQQTASASSGLEAKRQAAIDAGYSPAEVDAYVQKLMNARK